MGQRGKGTTKWILCITRTIRRRWLAGCRTSSRGLAYLDQHLRVGKRHLVGQGEAGIWCLFARALASGVGSTAVDWDGRDLGDDEAWNGALFAPGIRALGDVRTALALCAPGRLLVHGVGEHFPERVA